jgi:alkylation response protein AidB-like acyl-CoA dehydrogenase
VSRVANLVPKLAANAPWEEENRRLHEANLEAMGAAGVYKIRVPKRYGGYEVDSATLLDVISELAKGDGASAWNASVWAISGWLAGHFPDHVQDEVFSSPDVRVCGVLSPTASATPTKRGMTINGQWHFISGAWHSQWQAVLAMGPTPDGASQWPLMALVPMTDLSILDDWHTMGLRGTGSVSTVARDVFVPTDRVMPLVAILQQQSASAINPTSPVYRVPMMAAGCTAFTGTAVGMAKAAQATFMERLDRKITYTEYASQREAPVTHLQVAEALFKIEEAEGHAARLAATADAKGEAGEPWSIEDRVRARGQLGRTFRLAKEATELLNDASGGQSIYSAAPIQRIARDLHALSMHSIMHSTTTAELFGRVLCGLGPNTMYV